MKIVWRLHQNSISRVGTGPVARRFTLAKQQRPQQGVLLRPAHGQKKPGEKI
jgi:hypothetical protein